MKKITYYLLAIISFLSFTIPVYASSTIVITGVGVRFRTTPDTSTSANIITSFNPGVELTLIDDSVGSTSSCSKWYKASYNNTVGYVCGEFANIVTPPEEILDPETYQEYSEYLTELGFPESYIPYLMALHSAHPNWQFKAINVDTTFNRMVKLEHDGYEPGLSLFEDRYSNYDGYKATDAWGYNYLTDVFRSNYEGGEVNRWYAPNTATISYYLDPRNFLNERQIFMFETLSYNSAYHTEAGIEAMLKNTFMTGLADDEHTYIDAFKQAALTYNVSPYVLISRVIQEVGSWGSRITSGTVSGYEGYYNFYNIKAYGNTIDETINNGLAYAKENGWNTHYKAIVGGAAFLANNYINAGQDTLYSQKWDIIKPYVTHQYMQNIQAPSSECIRTYNSYNKNGLLDSSFVFAIPVYEDMPDKTSLPDSGNPNNYLKELTINDKVVFSSSSNDTVYSLTLPYGTEILTINAKTVNSNAYFRVANGNTVEDNSKELVLEVVAQNGDIRTYKINITIDRPILEFSNDTYEIEYGAIPFINELTINGPVGNVIYTSSNSNIANIDNTGLVTISNIGNVTITASLNESTATYTINIKPKNIELEVSNYEKIYQFNDSEVRPNVKVRIKDTTDELIENKDYTIEYENNTEPGLAKIYIKPISGGNYVFEDQIIEFNIIDNTTLLTGDINNDGIIELHEVTYTIKTYLGMYDTSSSNQSITLSNIISLLKKYLGIE